MLFVSYSPKSSPKQFLSQNKNQHLILNLCAKFELNWLRNKTLQKNLIFDGSSGLNSVMKFEMVSYSNNAYDVAIFCRCCCFEKFLTYTLFLPSLIVVRNQKVELNWGGCPPYPL